MKYAAWAALVVALATVLPARAYSDASLLFEFQDARITESSGVAVCSCGDDIIFTHNDSGDSARFFAVGSDGRTRATYTVSAAAAIDWEDMASGPGSSGGRALYFGDIGDNDELTRPVVFVYEVTEPNPRAAEPGATIALEPVRRIPLVYEDGAHNAETLLVDPRDGRILIVTKNSNGSSGLYAEQAGASPLLPHVLHRIATIRFDQLRQIPLSGAKLTTGGDIAADRSKVVVRTYYEAFEWTLGSLDIATAMTAPPASVTLLPFTQQGEAITYTNDSERMITTSEGTRAPVYLVS